MTYPIALIFVLLITSCAQKEAATSRLISNESEQWVAMTERLETQDKEIERLRLAVSDLQTKSLPEVEPAPTRKTLVSSNEHGQKRMKHKRGVATKKVHPLPVEKLTPADSAYLSVGALPRDPIAEGLGLEDTTIADSTQESLHLYYGALDSIENKKFEEALKKLDQFVKLNPKHVYADRAQYLMAEAAFQSKEHHLAIVATNVLESRYPYSVRIPDALLIRGRSLVAMDLKDKARDAYEKLVTNFPGASQADFGAKELALLAKPVTQSTALPALRAPSESSAEKTAPPLMPGDSAEENEAKN